jgi:large subunit ribosomal protein L11
MSKSIKSNIKFNAFATKVTAGPPIGPILGQQGIPIMDFCKNFNHETDSYNKTIPLRVAMTVFTDKTYKYTVSLPSTMFFVKHILEQTNSSKLSILWVYEIARIKQLHDMKGYDIQSICKMVLSTLKSANIELK